MSVLVHSSGDLDSCLPAEDHKMLAKHFLHLRAVPGGDSIAEAAVPLGRRHTLMDLIRMDWVSQLDDGTFQLTMKPLTKISMQFSLASPVHVFRKREDIPIQNASAFELIIELKRHGWSQGNMLQRHNNKRNMCFSSGFLANDANFVCIY